jgi:hypothetical protein
MTTPVPLPTRAAILVALAMLATLGCGGSFAPPARTDLDFAAARLGPAATELQAGWLDSALHDGDHHGVLQIGARHGVGAHDVIEAYALNYSTPGQRYAFSMAGLGYRRHLAEPGAPIQASLGFGAGAGVGGSYKGWDDGAKHYPPAVSGYVDLGASYRALSFLTLYAGGRALRSVAPTGDKASQPPVTDWAHFGGGMRIDVQPFFLALDLGNASAMTRDGDEETRTFMLAVGAHLGGQPVVPAAKPKPDPAPDASPPPAGD